MKILAVIPARAGSKGIPNKNIRIINGYPLIYYAITNALSSRFITDIIVSTNSPEIRIIATQMGVKCKWRDASLCGDAVTLDAVVADAVSLDIAWGYVVTMQPTSLTLQSETLDSAIEYTVKNNLDTVISVVNDPHLSWVEKNGKKVPSYTERLNRQYLPACYKETGAFLISKTSVVTPKTRIGENINVFEIPKDQAIDVDSFLDLQNAATILKEDKAAIYVNGNNHRGIGHIYRALEIADEFFLKPDIYYDINQTNPNVFGSTNHRLIPVDGIVELFEYCKKNRYTIFVNDILTTSIDYMIGLRSILPDAKIINFEDDGEGVAKADLVFNDLYHESFMPHIKAGEQYYIPAKTFMFYEPIQIREKVKRVFISFGGADPQNYSDRLLNIISKRDYEIYNFVVVLGRAKHNVKALLEYNKHANIEVLYDISNMPELMSRCDIGITSRGRTGYELAILGIPSIAMAQNKREEKHGFVCNENGFTYLGLNPPDEIIESSLKMFLDLSYNSRQRFKDMLLSHNLRNGRKCVMNLINSL